VRGPPALEEVALPHLAPAAAAVEIVDDFLAGAPSAERELARAAVCRSPVLVLPAGKRCLTWPASTAFVLVGSGLVLVRAGAPGLRDVVVGEARGGSVVLPPPPAGALQALEDSRLLLVDTVGRDALLGIPAGAVAIAEGLQAALVNSREAAGLLAAMRSRTRIESKLMLLARAHGRVLRSGVRIDFPLTHERLADMTGTARETVTRVLEQLEGEGFLAREGRSYELYVSPEELAA
jgi:CRP-like cAMP-binding protein